MEAILSDLSVLSVALFAAGIFLLVIEMFHPGFGVPGLCGIVCLTADVCITAKTLRQGLILLAIVLGIILVMLILCIVLAQKGMLPGKLILKQATDRASGFSISGGEGQGGPAVGAQGVARTILRPAGIAEFEGKRLDVVTQGEFIQPNEPIEIIQLEANRIVVRSVKAPEAAK